MAKTGINFERCNVGAVELHNDRSPEYLESVKRSGRELYIFQDRQHLNRSWGNSKYKGATCAEIFEKQKIRYKEKVGQEPNLEDRIRIDKKTGKQITVAGWSPIREGVCPIKEDTKLEDFKPFIDWCNENGLTVIRIDLHFDEGYESMVDDIIKQRKYNRHAHIVVDWMNWETSKTAKLGKDKMSEAQDIIAMALDMERGEKKSETGKEHLSPSAFKEKTAEEHSIQLKRENQELKNENTELRTKNTELKSENIGLLGQINDKLKYKKRAKEAEAALEDEKTARAKDKAEYEQTVILLQKELENEKKRANRAELEAKTLYSEKEKYRKECNRLDIAVQHWRNEANQQGQQTKSKGIKQ